MANIYNGSVYEVSEAGPYHLKLKDTGYISAHDGERYEHIQGLAKERTTQTSCAMRFLAKAGVANAYISKLNPTSIRCDQADMLKLEVVGRGCGIGSFAQRNPRLKVEWFKTPVVEVFHKQTFDTRTGKLEDGNQYRTLGAAEVKRLKDAKIIFPDPLIIPGEDGWTLFDASAPTEFEKPLAVIPPVVSMEEYSTIANEALRAYLSLNQAFARVDCGRLRVDGLNSVALADIKFEFGYRRKDGKLLLCDVVNLDSLRLVYNGTLGPAMKHLSKQRFRDGDKPADVLKVYQQGTELFRQL